LTARLAPYLLLVSALLGWSGMAPPAAGARVARGFVGLIDDDLIGASPPVRRVALRAEASAGAGTLRQVFDWARIERHAGRYDLSAYDSLVADSAAAGLGVLPVLTHPPGFRSSRPRRHARRGVYPPRSDSDMGRFAAVLVRRYGPAGTLWKERPDLPSRPIRSWQVWNEPNLSVYWASGVSPRGYTRLLATVGRAIKRVDRGAEIVTAGLPQSRLGMPFERFVTGIYQAGGRSAFDTLAVHPYARGSRGVLGAARLARRLMNRNGDRRAHIWITELGWATGGPQSVFRVGPRGQASRIRGALLGLARLRSRLLLRGVVYYKWRDTRRPKGPDFFGNHTGLLETNGRRKPGYYAFWRAARSLRR
jgi:hypothetical protein